MGVPTKLPTMLYEPNREAVQVWPHDGSRAYLVTRAAIERRIGKQRRLSPDQLVEACEEHELYFAIIAARKAALGEVDPDERAVVMAHTVKSDGAGRAWHEAAPFRRDPGERDRHIEERLP